MALPEDFTAKYPTFNTPEFAALWPTIEGLLTCYYGCAYGSSDCADNIICLLIAHLATVSLSGQTGSEKTVVGQSVGNVSESFATPENQTQRATFFGSTIYGQQFLVLTASRIGTFFV